MSDYGTCPECGDLMDWESTCVNDCRGERDPNEWHLWECGWAVHAHSMEEALAKGGTSFGGYFCDINGCEQEDD